MQLSEQYRPRTWTEVIGQDAALQKIDLLRPRGLGGRAYFLSGPSGTGKTTIARLLAGELAEPMNVDELDAQELTAPRVRDLASSLRTYGMGSKPGRAVIVNEAHGLRADAVRAFLVTLEAIPPHGVYLFTTTTDGAAELFESQADAAPLLSRCIRLPLARQGLAEPFARHLLQLAYREGLADGAGDDAALRIVREHRNNLRAALQAVEAGALLGL